MLYIVQAEAHRGLKLQDVPSGAVSAQQNVILLQPVGQDTAGPFTWPPRPSSVWLWPPGQNSSDIALGTLHMSDPLLGQGTDHPLQNSRPSFVAWPQRPTWGALHLTSLLPRARASPHLFLESLSSKLRLVLGLQYGSILYVVFLTGD